MQAKPHDYARSRKIQTITLTVAAAVFSVALIVTVIIFCYHSTHLKF